MHRRLAVRKQDAAAAQSLPSLPGTLAARSEISFMYRCGAEGKERAQLYASREVLFGWETTEYPLLGTRFCEPLTISTQKWR